jgi:hypothetical protein
MDTKNYNLALPVCFFFERAPQALFTSSCVKNNHEIFVSTHAQLLALSLLLKYELHLSQNQLVEHSAIDTSLYTGRTDKVCNWFSVNAQLVFFSFYFFFLKKRGTFFFTHNGVCSSIDSVYPNAN